MQKNFFCHTGSFAHKIFPVVRGPVFCPVSGFCTSNGCVKIFFIQKNFFCTSKQFSCESIVLKRIFRLVHFQGSIKIEYHIIKMNHNRTFFVKKCYPMSISQNEFELHSCSEKWHLERQISLNYILLISLVLFIHTQQHFRQLQLTVLDV